MRQLIFPRGSAAALLLSLSANIALAQESVYRYLYDANGNLTQVTDPLAQVTKYTYDPLNRRIQSIDPNNGVTRYGYDGLGQLIQVSDARNLVTRYTVDGLGNQLELASPDTGTTLRNYDAAGNIERSIDAKEQATFYEYDALNRTTLMRFNDGSTVAYLYDQGLNAIGRLSRIADLTGTTQYSYDPLGRVVLDERMIDGKRYSTAYRYDAGGRLASVRYPSGRLVSYGRDSVGRISQISVSRDQVTQVVVREVSYQPFGPVKSIVFGNGDVYARTYDLDGRMVSYTLNGQVQTIGYDAASRITVVTDSGNAANNVSYGYDNLDRLTSALKSTSSFGYAYDAVGNRTNLGNAAANTSYLYGATSNRLTQVNGSRVVAIGTDANGSITSNSANQFRYDARGRMVSAVTPMGLVRYLVNGLGQRVKKITPSETTDFHYDVNGTLIGESSVGYHTDYVYLGDVPVAVLR